MLPFVLSDFLIADMSVACACALSPIGRFDLLELIWTRSQRGVKTTLSSLLKTNRQYYRWEFSEILVQAIRRQDLAIVQWLLDHFSGCPVSETVVREAAKGGHLWFLQLLEADKSHSGVQWGGEFFAHCLTDAAKAGHWELMRWLHERASNEETRGNNHELLEIAVMQNKLEMVKWVVANGFDHVTFKHEDCPREEWERRVEILHYLLDEGIGDSAFIVGTSLMQAVKLGDLKTTRWLLARNEQFDDRVSFYESLYTASEQGNLRMVQELLERVDCLGQAGGPSEAMRIAAKNGKLNVVRWLWEHCSRDPTVSLFQNRDPTAMEVAAAEGHLDVLQYLDRIEAESHRHVEEERVKRSCHRDRYPTCTSYAMDAAAANGQLEVVKWLHAYRTEGCTEAVMDDAAGNGHLKVVQWLHWNRFEGATTAAMDKAATRRFHEASCRELHPEKCCLGKAPKSFYEGQLEILCWLYSNRSEGCTSAAMDGAAANGNFEVLRWLYENELAAGTTKAIDAAAAIGRLDIVQWLHAQVGLRCTTDAMDNAAAGGHLRVVQWLHVNRNEGCTDKALNLAASNGHVHVVRWLLAYRSEGRIIAAMEQAIACQQWEVMWYLDAQRTSHTPSLRSICARLRNANLGA